MFLKLQKILLYIFLPKGNKNLRKFEVWEVLWISSERRNFFRANSCSSSSHPYFSFEWQTGRVVLNNAKYNQERFFFSLSASLRSPCIHHHCIVSLYVCVCVYVCVFEREREKKRERYRERERERKRERKRKNAEVRKEGS